MFGNKFNWSFYSGNRPFTITAANQLPNLNLWYNASTSSTTINGVSTANFNTAVSNGTLISSWTDLTGLGADANVNGGSGKRPAYATPIQNSLGAVQYTSASSTNFDINPAAWSQNLSGLTIYVVARPTTLSGLFPLVVSDTFLGIWWNGTNWTVGQSSGNNGTVTLTNDTTKFHQYGIIFNGAATGNSNRLKLRYDKANATLSYTGTVGTTTGSPSYWFFGGDNRGSAVNATFTTTYMDGYIGEVLIWTRALSTSEYLAAESYIANKWAI